MILLCTVASLAFGCGRSVTDRGLANEQGAFLAKPPRAYVARCALFQPCVPRELKACAEDGVGVARALEVETGKSVVVRAELHGHFGMCTDSSPPAKCGDACDGGMFLVDGDARLPLDGVTCEGDDSGVCCPFALGRPIQVTGVVVNLESKGKRLLVDRACRP